LQHFIIIFYFQALILTLQNIYCIFFISDAFISCTLHWVDANFVLKRSVVDIAKFEGKHTGRNIALKLDEIIDNLPGRNHLSNIVATHDAGANMKKATDMATNIDHRLICIDHTLNNIVEYAFKHDTCAAVRDALSEFNKLASHLHRSHKSVQVVKERCKNQAGNNHLF